MNPTVSLEGTQPIKIKVTLSSHYNRLYTDTTADYRVAQCTPRPMLAHYLSLLSQLKTVVFTLQKLQKNYYYYIHTLSHHLTSITTTDLQKMTFGGNL